MLTPGDILQVKAYKADGDLYRWWLAQVESAAPDEMILVAPAGHKVEGSGRNWISEYTIRSYYWLGRPFNLLEVYRADGSFVELYAHIASPPEWESGQLCYIDYELDAVLLPGRPVFIDDEEEFEEAARLYGYSEELQQACRQAAQAAIRLLEGWVPRECPLINPKY